jgi:hypothetical protein
MIDFYCEEKFCNCVKNVTQAAHSSEKPTPYEFSKSMISQSLNERFRLAASERIR